MKAVTAALALLLASALPVSPGAAAGTAVSAAEIPDNATRLSRMLNPSDKIVEVGVRAFDAGFMASATGKSDDAAFFEEHPGLVETILEATQPVVRKHMIAGMPALQERFAGFYARSFTASEIDSLIAFYSSSTGAKMVEGMYAGADLGKLVESVGEDGKDPVTSDEVRNFTRSTVERILPAFGEEDRKILMEFAASPAFAKMVKVMPEFRQMMADIANQPAPAMEAGIEQIVKRAVEDYFARRSTGRLS